ncbi:LapA family protein [Paenibacillus sp.]|uniref:LapA family protein n=1 Tax=Paenibacillus sp. TaxID=58172 RepID=UPI002D43FB37|nr:lipopolysaccharide assembly protein LapA domain-containing protein [Paenibacillus sp.]HZG86916.1 lipopolysaccharide assembly protein LapA domain-containing protein [Paenibacillus sp.]
MKQQWSLILGFFFALVVAVFSVLNVESVPVDYAFGTASFPLIVVILASAFAGGLTVGLFGTIRILRQSRDIRQLRKELQTLKDAAPKAPDADAPQPAAPAANASTELLAPTEAAGDDTK